MTQLSAGGFDTRDVMTNFDTTMSGISVPQYEAQIKTAREQIAAHDQRISAIVDALWQILLNQSPVGVFPCGVDSEVDFCPFLKAYARSKELDPLLVESQLLYNDMIPTMVRQFMEDGNGCSPYDDTMDRDDRIESCKSDAKYMEVMSAVRDWEFKYYTHKEFAQIAQGSEAPE
jgi:hypothetical protein